MTLSLPHTEDSILDRLKEVILRFAAALRMAPETPRLHRLFESTVADHDAMIRRICLGYSHTSREVCEYPRQMRRIMASWSATVLSNRR